jgi:tRNA(Ser,Leu) C12 N-acetylase TAN1
MVSWVAETLDILHPRSEEEESKELQAVETNKALLDEFHQKLAEYKLKVAELEAGKSADKDATDTPADATNGDEQQEDTEEDFGDLGALLFGSALPDAVADSAPADSSVSAAVEKPHGGSSVPADDAAADNTADDADERPRKRQKCSSGPQRPDYPQLLPISRVLSLELGIRGVGFIHITTEGVDPTAVCMHMLETQLKEQKKVHSRSVMRMLPISSSCFASIESMTTLCSELLPKLLASIPSGSSVGVHIDRRTKNENMSREEIQRTVFAAVPSEYGLKVDHRNPDYTIVVQVWLLSLSHVI